MSILTIAIPTYNRREKLLSQVSNLLKQDDRRLFEIVVIDNASGYDVNEVLSEFDSKKIKIVRNKVNIGMPANLVSPFLYAQTKWLWIVSDDDELLENSVQRVLDSLESSAKDVGMIKFSRDGYLNQEGCAGSLEEFVDYYYYNSIVGSGDLVFVSTNVFNLDLLRDYIGYAFEYSYTYIGFLVPVIMALNQNKIFFVSFSPESIVRYCSPEGDGWDYYKGAKGLSTIAHLPLRLSRRNIKKFYSVAMAVSYKSLVVRFLDDPAKHRVKDILIVYATIYKYYLPWRIRIPFCVFIVLIRYKLARILFSRMWGIRRVFVKRAP